MNTNLSATRLSSQAFQRMPYYLQYLKTLAEDGQTTVSASSVAAYFGYNEVRVRKDFAAVSPSQGKPRQGFELNELINAIELILGYRYVDRAVLIGVGSLGRALIQHGRFEKYGLKIEHAFDNNPALLGTVINGAKILPAKDISILCRREGIQIGIITVPETQAQIVCDQLVAGGVLAIWNFAQLHLIVPEGILVQNENMTASLALLSRHLHEKLAKGEPR